MASKGKGGSPKTPPKKSKAPAKPVIDKKPDDAAATRRVALMRNKLTAAMEDPLMRSQIVEAIRAMMKNGR